jgi:prepilin-type N-terminal cleavage/methylation domain-containing protein
MKFLKKGSSRGFTIIEVVIVLAIAGLILLLVFQAVPALQRNNRNTQIRNASATLLGGVNDFVAANNGRLPQGVNPDPTTGVVQFTGTFAGAQPVTVNVSSGYTITWTSTAPAAGVTGTIALAGGFKCNNNVLGPATPRAAAALFNIENAGTTTAAQCVET